MQTMDMMTAFMDMMWAQNFRILNVLHHQAEDQEKEQADAEQAHIQQQSQGAWQTDPPLPHDEAAPTAAPTGQV